MSGQNAGAIVGASVGRTASLTAYPGNAGRTAVAEGFHLPSDNSSKRHSIRLSDRTGPACELASARKAERAHRTLQNYQCDELVREGRSLGFQWMILTQKPTGEAVPTKIRDNCQIAMSFAQRSTEAAKAALGEDIADYPHAHPRRLQDPSYVGVLSVVADGRPGYTLVRTPLTRDTDAAELAVATAGLVLDPLEALREHTRTLRPVPNLDDAPAA